MPSKNIIVSTESFYSNHAKDIIASNRAYIKELFQHNINDNNIHKDALKSYYIDCYLSEIQATGFKNFTTKIKNDYKVIYYIQEALKMIGAIKHIALLNDSLKISHEKEELFEIFDTLFQEFQKEENLLERNYTWLIKHPDIIHIEAQYMDFSAEQQSKSLGKEKRHTKIIKQLCNIANEDFLRVTAGDENNLYNNSWYFQTVQGHYYMIEKNKKVTMYNSFTKEEVIKANVSDTSANYSSMFLGLFR